MSKPKAAAKSPDLESVARAAGVSTATVSRVINRSGLVADATRAKVLRAIERAGYVPNRIAGGLAANRTGLIAVIVPSLLHSVFSETIQSMTEELSRSGFQVLLGLSGDEDQNLERIIESVLSRRPDGIILTALPGHSGIRRQVAAMGIPVIETWEHPKRPLDMAVGFSHAKAGAVVADFVAARGYRLAAAISADSPRAAARRDAFCQRMRQLGLPQPQIETVQSPSTVAHGRAALGRLFAAHRERPEVIVCSSDWLALGCLVEARARGLRVPADVGVLGFGNLDFAADLEPPLSTVHVDGHEIGRQAVQLIAQRASGLKPTYRFIDIPVRITERGSCRAIGAPKQKRPA